MLKHVYIHIYREIYPNIFKYIIIVIYIYIYIHLDMCKYKHMHGETPTLIGVLDMRIGGHEGIQISSWVPWATDV